MKVRSGSMMAESSRKLSVSEIRSSNPSPTEPIICKIQITLAGKIVFFNSTSDSDFKCDCSPVVV